MYLIILDHTIKYVFIIALAVSCKRKSKVLGRSQFDLRDFLFHFNHSVDLQGLIDSYLIKTHTVENFLGGLLNVHNESKGCNKKNSWVKYEG